MPVAFVPVSSSRDFETFIDLPRRLYAQDRRFVPPLTFDRRQHLDPKKSPFFTHGEAQYWLALRDGEPVGRISAQIDRAATSEAFRGTGMFGCLDVVNDPAVVRGLVRQAEDWLRARGMSRMRGPCLLSMNGEPGLLVAGQGEGPMVLVPWHPEYLAPLLESCGFERVRDLYYFRIPITEDALAPVAAKMRLSDWRAGLRVRHLDRFNPTREIECLRAVYNDAWQHNWGFIPLLEQDLAAFKTQLRPFMRPEYGTIVEKDGEALGVSLAMPNLAEMSADLGPNPSPLGWLRLLWRGKTQKFRTARIILLGVKAQCSKTLEGVAVAMTLVDELVQLAKRYDLPAVEAGWVLDNNRPMIAILERFGAKRVRTLRLYDREIAASEGRKD